MREIERKKNNGGGKEEILKSDVARKFWGSEKRK